MNKADLVAKITGDSELSKTDAEKALSSAIAGISGALKKGDGVTLIGFGTFSVSKRAARKGRNPLSGAEIIIPAKTVVKFKAGKGLSGLV